MTRKVTTLAMFSVLMVVGGYILYFISRIIPIPGSKFIIMGPYLTLIMMLPLARYPRYGTLSLINIVFAGIMLIFSPWMSLTIIVSGLAADCVMLLPLWRKLKLLLSMGIYNGVSLLSSIYITSYVTGNVLYRMLSIEVLLTILAVAILMGMLGGYAGLRIDELYLKRYKR